MIEVETKIRVANPKKIRKEARKLGRFIGTEFKVDDYYALNVDDKYPGRSLRIRKVNGFYIVNFKHGLSYKKGVHAKKEVEFKVSNINDFLNLIRDFGFKRWLRKEKRCEIYKIKDNFQIELNNVKNLGWFVEIEFLVKKESEIKKARDNVANIIRKLGLDERNAIKKGYTKMILEKMRK